MTSSGVCRCGAYLVDDCPCDQVERVFPAGGSSVGNKNLSLGQPGKSQIMDAAIAARREASNQDTRADG